MDKLTCQFEPPLFWRPSWANRKALADLGHACPLCGWSPNKQDLWSCTCGHAWNTFDTGGVCPGCMHQWTSTQCLACGRGSPHSDWYEE